MTLNTNKLVAFIILNFDNVCTPYQNLWVRHWVQLVVAIDKITENYKGTIYHELKMVYVR